MRYSILVAATVMLCACSGESDGSVQLNVAATNGSSENAGTPTSELTSGEAVVTFGNETFDALSSIKCRGSSAKPRFSANVHGKYQGGRVTIVLMSVPDRRGAVAINIRGEIGSFLKVRSWSANKARPLPHLEL